MSHSTSETHTPVTPKTSSIAVPGRWQRFRESYLVYSFKRDWMAQACLLVFIAMVLGAFLAPWIAPADPYDLATIDIMNSELPPAWMAGGDRPSCWAPMPRGEICSPPFCTAHACRC
ncbi:hypothetical protein ACU8V3_01200 [Cobetia marina]